MMLTTERVTEEEEGEGDVKETTSPRSTTSRFSNATGKVSSVTDLSILGNYEPDFDEKACEANVCRNGGTCLATLTGPKCHCPLQFSGRQCEEEVQVKHWRTTQISWRAQKKCGINQGHNRYIYPFKVLFYQETSRMLEILCFAGQVKSFHRPHVVHA